MQKRLDDPRLRARGGAVAERVACNACYEVAEQLRFRTFVEERDLLQTLPWYLIPRQSYRSIP